MASILNPPVESDGTLLFTVEHAGRQYTVTVKLAGGVTATGDLGAFNELVAAVRRYATNNRQEVPESFHSSRDLFPAG